MKILDIFYNKPLLTSVMAFFIAQMIKIIPGVIINKKIPWDRVMGTGGMPSSHTAGVCALFTSLGIKHGFASTEFAISFVFASIIMYDATGIRYAAGEHAQVLNHIMENLHEAMKEGIQHIKLKTLLGHTHGQVWLGAILGICVALISYYFF
ncbi:MAG: divergent PAP2 family protein [Spirochaetes bacterium]|nr:divergent PAP2 family protein [Spirochaetota bacterium]